MNAPFLYALYKDLARNQPLLGTSLHEYYALLELVSSGRYPIRTFADLAFVLESLWVKSYEQRGLFRELLATRRLAIEEWVNALREELSAVESESPQSEMPTGQANAGASPEPPGQKDDVPAPTAPLPMAEPPAESAAHAGISPMATAGFSISRERLPQRALLQLQHRQGAPIPANQTPFHFGDEYHPVKSRQLQQTWRTLKNNRPGPLSPEVDIPKTIFQTAKQGYFSTLHHIRHEYNHIRLILLLDHGANMVAVESFGEELLAAARDSKWHQDVHAWYFQRVPRMDKTDGDYVFSNVASTARATLRSLVRGTNKKDVAVLVYSDAGAINFECDEQRSREWLEFVRVLRQRVGHVAWINPAPKNRWGASNAGKIEPFVPMFEASRHGIERAVAALKGKPKLTR